MRPPGPVGVTAARSPPSSCAIRRALVPFGHEPTGHLPFGQAFAEVRQFELIRHRRRSLPANVPRFACEGMHISPSPPRTADPSVPRRDQETYPSIQAPDGHGLLGPVQLRRDLAGHVAQLDGARLVPDRDGVRIELVLGLAYERETAAGIERRVV